MQAEWVGKIMQHLSTQQKTKLGVVLYVWAALQRKHKSGICTLADCFCYICHVIPLARVQGDGG